MAIKCEIIEYCIVSMKGNELEPNIALGKHGWMIARPRYPQAPASKAFDGDKKANSPSPSPFFVGLGAWLAVDLEKTTSILRTVAYPSNSRFTRQNYLT